MKTQLKYFLACTLLVFTFSYKALADQQQDPALTKAMLNQYSLITPQILAERHYWLELGLQSDIGLSEAGVQTGIGYRLNYFGIDFRFSAGKTSYRKIHSLASHNQLTEVDPNPEIDLTRNKSDSWSYWSLEPGFSISSRLFSGYLPKFTERVRVGLNYGSYEDNINHIPFKSYILNVETSVIYQLRPDYPWSLCGSLNWNSGMLVRYYVDSEGKNQSYGLPASWVGTSLGMLYSF
jgi:hypothetical protein